MSMLPGYLQELTAISRFQPDYILFICGALLILLALSCSCKAKAFMRRSLSWFFLLQGIGIWLSVVSFSLADGLPFLCGTNIITVFSYLCLLKKSKVDQEKTGSYYKAIISTVLFYILIDVGNLLLLSSLSMIAAAISKGIVALLLLLFMQRGACSEGEKGKGKVNYQLLGAVVVAGIFVAGWAATEYIAKDTDEEFRGELLIQAQMAAVAVKSGKISDFSAFLDDGVNHEYEYGDEDLKRLKNSNPLTKWVYVMVERNGQILFAFSSEGKDSPDSAEPGQVYVSPPDELSRTFFSGQAMTAGPYTDEWGTFLSGFAAIRDVSNNRLIGVVGIDVDGAEWQRFIFRHRLAVISVTMLIYLIVLGFAAARQRLWRASRKTAASEERLALALQGANDGLWDWNLITNEVYFSPQWKRMLGYAEEEIDHTPQAWNNLIHEEDKERVLAAVSDYLEGGSAKLEYEVRLRKKDGSYGDILARAFAVRRDSDGQARRLVGTHVDISERNRVARQLRKAKETAEEATKMKSAFLANMSHEIRTPMNAILGFTQLLLRDSTSSTTQRQQLETIHRSGEHLLALINDILEMSKIEAGRIGIVEEDFDLYQLESDIEMMFQARIKEKALHFQSHIEEGVPQYVVTDKQRVRQILVNLLGNAVKFTQYGQISVTWKLASGKVSEEKQVKLVWQVMDTGPGINEKEIGNLFQPFTQAAAGLKMGGTGLGLAISREYARLLGGDITVSSTTGKGSCFTLEIVVVIGKEDREKRVFEANSKVQKVQGALETYRIMVVDDVLENRQLLTLLLQDVGFDTVEAVDGEDAIKKARDLPPHLILMDVRMPGIDGYEATRRIKELHKKISIIGISASVLPEDQERAKSSGMDKFVHKPFRENDIFAAIAQCLQITYEYDARILQDEKKILAAEAAPTVSVAVLPSALREKLIVALLRARVDEMEVLLQQVSDYSPPLAAKMREMVNNFEYDKLLAILKGGTSL